MPSPTLSTWPTSLTCASAPKFWISRLRIAEISAGWMSMSVSSHGGAKPFELRAQRRIDHARAHLHDESAQKRGVNLGLKPSIAAERGLENLPKLCRLRIAQCTRRRHFGIDLAALPRDQGFVDDDDIDKREKSTFC